MDRITPVELQRIKKALASEIAADPKSKLARLAVRLLNAVQSSQCAN